ncbi:MAG TPA: integration host factor subunit alpha [Firmicutes bacterium]|jgi:DNA-binding protein HU-beta|nr:integration host factor subunit alpha [Bacillota bacterium]
MTKTDLIDKVAQKTGGTKKDAAVNVDAVFEALTEAMAAGDKVQIIGFGSFEVRKREARKGRNPQTGAEIDIPAQNAPVFSAGKSLKEVVNKK